MDLFCILLTFIETLLSYEKCQKAGVRRGLGRVIMKNLLAETILDKIFGTKWSDLVKLDRKRKVCCLFLRVFLTAI